MPALFKTYNRFDLSIAEAEGSKVTDINGKTYLDFGAGISVNNLGHRHPTVQKAIEDQLKKYWHVSNLYHVPIQEEVAQALTVNSTGDYVFFCNSGAEANEAAIKLARKATGKEKIITCKQSFHGRTIATMSATGQEKIQEGFGPLLKTFEYVPFNDLEAVKEAIDPQTGAIMLEVIQGEGGIIVGDPFFIMGIEKLCKENDLVLIIDEIQTGLGRTGKPFAYQHYGISPDIITVAKALGNGIPVGAMIAKAKYYDVFGPGSHGTTFGGNPLAMAAARAVLGIIFQDEFIEVVEKKSAYLQKQLDMSLAQLPFVLEIRGKGLMIGIECQTDVSEIISTLMDKGLLVLNAGPNVIRLLPPLNITEKEIDLAVKLIYETIEAIS
jgi:acetylornithine aminotransferase